MSVRDPRRRRVPRYWTARADAGPEPSPTTMPLFTHLSTVSLAASKRSATSASAAEAEQATPRRLGRRTDGRQRFRRGLGQGRSCAEEATLALAMASIISMDGVEKLTEWRARPSG